MSSANKFMADAGKIVAFIVVAHLYILLCSVAYKNLEGIDVPSNETVNGFLLELQRGLLSSQDPAKVLQKYNQVKRNEDYWKERNDFNSIPKSFVYTLSAHTTLGNRRMNVKTQRAQLFYILTVPLGVLLYYVMIHYIGLQLLEMVQEAVMLVWRKEDDNLSDRQRNIFVRLKLSGTMIFYATFLLLCLSLASLFQARPFVTELGYIVDIFLSISSSENFVLYNLLNDNVDAFITTITYFVCILFAYSTSFSIWSVFYTYSVQEVWAFVRGDRNVYEYLSEEQCDKKKDTSVWKTYYDTPDNMKLYNTKQGVSLTQSAQKDAKHLGTGDRVDEKIRASPPQQQQQQPQQGPQQNDYDDLSDLFHTVESVLDEQS